MTSFRSKITKMKWKFTQKDKDENVKLRTHNLMDGGELSIPESEYDNFLKICSECICGNEKLYLVEQRSHPFYKCFFDFDVFLYEIIDDTTKFYLSISKLLVSCINELFEDSVGHFEIFCSVANVKQARKNQKDCHKYGVHFTIPSLIVDKEKMTKIREAVVQKFENNLDKDGPTTWAEDIDRIVYESTGFRMNFSRKGGKCKCSQKQRDLCEKCEGTGKIDEGRPYIPFLTIDNNYSYTLCQKDLEFDFIYDNMKNTSIRVNSIQKASLVEFNKSLPSWFEDVTAHSLFHMPDGLITSPYKKLKTSEGLHSVESKLENKINLSLQDTHYFNIWFESLCNKSQLPKQYKGIDVTDIFSFTNNNVRSNIIARIDSQYCMNIGREHSTNTVYMLVNLLTKSAVMKCYCRCETTEGRRSIVNGKKQMCKDFSSHTIDASDLQLSVKCDITSRVIKPRILAMF